jgi:hypothetical protein
VAVLEGNKRYPADARSRHETGVVEVSFSIDHCLKRVKILRQNQCKRTKTFNLGAPTKQNPENKDFLRVVPFPAATRTQPLCTLRVRRCRRLTQHSLPGGLLGLTWAGLAPADRASFAWRLPSFDHLVGGDEQRRRHGEAERLSSFAIDDQLKFGWALYRQFTGFFTFKDTIDICRCLQELKN